MLSSSKNSKGKSICSMDEHRGRPWRGLPRPGWSLTNAFLGTGERRSLSLKGYRLEPKICALLICLLGFALLVHDLDEKSLWGDEAYTASVVAGDLESAIRITAEEGYPPIYYVCMWIWTTYMGDSEFALRFLSVIFGMLSIAMLYPLGRKMTSKGVGLMAMGLMAISPFLVLHSRMARYYTLLLFLSLVSYWFFVQVLDVRGTVRSWVGYVVSSALGMYTHYLFAFVLAAQGVAALVRIRRRGASVLGLIGSQVIVALLFAPWLVVMMQSAVKLGAMPDAFAGSKPILWMLSIVYPFFAWAVGGTTYPWNPAAPIGVILALGLAGRGLLSGTSLKPADTMEETLSGEARRRAVAWTGSSSFRVDLGSFRTSQVLTLVIFILLPLFPTIATIIWFIGGASFLGVPIRAIFCAPFLYLLIAKGTHAIGGSRLRLFSAGGLVIVLGLSLAKYYQGREFHNPNYVLQIEDLASLVVDQAQPGDVFVSDFMTAFDYYISRNKPQSTHFLAHDPEEAGDHIEEHESPRVWLILVCRVVETESLASVELVPWLLNEGYSLELTFSYAPQDEIYGRVQELALGKPACDHKVIVYRYRRSQSSLSQAGVS